MEETIPTLQEEGEETIDTIEENVIVSTSGVSSLNGQTGDLILKTVNSQNLVGTGNLALATKAEVGNLSNLDTQDKTSIVNAINEVAAEAGTGTVQSVNHIGPDANGNITLTAANVGAQSTLSSAQLAAVNSGATSAKIGQIATNTTNISNLQTSVSGKQDKLTTTQLAAVNSGINSTKVGQIATNTTNISNLQTSVAGKQDKLSTSQLAAVNSGIDTTKVGQIATNTSDISTINGKIPAAATTQNQLADKSFVNSSIATNTAYYISDDGQPFQSLADLEAYSGPVTNNDYAFVVGTDAAGNTTYTRYKYNAQTEEWAEEYVLNNSSFTADQWAAISSGITSGDVAKLTGLADIQSIGANLSLNSLTGELSATDTTYTAGTNVSISAQNVISATDTTYTAGSNVSISAQNVISATDTTYNDFVGTDGVATGTAGLVPAPTTSDVGKVLGSSGNWETPSGGVKTLTAADYNWNAENQTTTNPDCIAFWLLDEGYYKVPQNLNFVYYTWDTQYEDFNGLIFVSFSPDEIWKTVVICKSESGIMQSMFWSQYSPGQWTENGGWQNIITDSILSSALSDTIAVDYALPDEAGYANTGKVVTYIQSNGFDSDARMFAAADSVQDPNTGDYLTQWREIGSSVLYWSTSDLDPTTATAGTYTMSLYTDPSLTTAVTAEQLRQKVWGHGTLKLVCVDSDGATFQLCYNDGHVVNNDLLSQSYTLWLNFSYFDYNGRLTRLQLTAESGPDSTVFDVTVDSGPLDLVQTKGSSTTKVMSQNAVSTMAIGTNESSTITTSSWTVLPSSLPYTYQVTITPTYTLTANTFVELKNDAPVLFAKHGFAIASLDVANNHVTLYSIGVPDASVTLAFNYKEDA